MTLVHGLTTAEHEGLNRLRRENRVLREEREILAKAAAWFAQETGATPSRRSHSLELTMSSTWRCGARRSHASGV